MPAETREMMISDGESLARTLFFGLIIVPLGCSLNGLIIATYVKWHRSLLTKARDILVLSLAFGNLLMSSLACPLVLAANVAQKWTTGYAGCVFYGFLSAWIGLSSILQLAALAVEGYITLSQSTLNSSALSRTLQLTATCWLAALLASCFPLVGWSEYGFEGYGFHCAVLWNSQTVSNFSYNIFLLVFFFVVPIAAILFSYAKLTVVVRNLYFYAKRAWGVRARATQSTFFAQVRIAKQLAVVIGGFLFAWTPYAVVCLVRVAGDFSIPVVCQEYPALFAKASVVYTPLIYFFSYRRLRVKAVDLLKRSRNSVCPQNGSDSRMARTIYLQDIPT